MTYYPNLNKLFFILFSVFVYIPCLSFANTAGHDWFGENFEQDFNTSGWEIVSKKANDSWKLVKEVDDGIISPSNGSYFAYIEGIDSYDSYEILVSPVVNLHDTKRNEWVHAYFTFNFAITDDNPDFDFYLLTCFDCEDLEGVNWITEIDAFNDQYWRTELDGWIFLFYEMDHYIKKGPFRIGFLFSGITTQGLGLDEIEGFGSSRPLDNEKDEDGCGCGTTSSKSSVFPVFIMLLIGWFILKWHALKEKRRMNGI